MTAIIGDVGGYVEHLRQALASLGVTDDVWPDGLHVIQVGDLIGGRDDVEAVRLVSPHVYAGRWTQLIGNWELAAVGGPELHTREGRSPHPDALAAFSRWHAAGAARFATTATASSGKTAVVTHAGIGWDFWCHDLGGIKDPATIAQRLNTMPIEQVARPGEMFQRTEPGAPGPVWASVQEVWRGWASCPFPQVHGHTTARFKGGWSQWAPADLVEHAHHNRGHVTFRPSDESEPIIGIDPGLWDRSPLTALRPLVLRSP